MAHIISDITKNILKAPVHFYRMLVSPVLPRSCRFFPSCSSYCLEAIDKHNVFYACLLCIKRVLKCNPLFDGGYDPVPSNHEKSKINKL